MLKQLTFSGKPPKPEREAMAGLPKCSLEALAAASIDLPTMKIRR